MLLTLGAVGITIALGWRLRDNRWATVALAALGVLGGVCLFALLVSISARPGPPAKTGTWANGNPVAQTASHVFLIDASGLHVASVNALQDHAVLPWDGGIVRTTASDGTAVLVTYFEEAGAAFRGGWGLAAPNEWLVPPHGMQEHSPNIGAWWSPSDNAFFVASLSRPDVPEAGPWTLMLESISAQGQVTEAKTVVLTEHPEGWDSAMRILPCRVGEEVWVAAVRGPACRLLLGDTPRCVPVAGTEGARCNNDHQTYVAAQERQLTTGVPEALPSNTAHSTVLSLWYAFNKDGDPTRVTKEWTGRRQEFRAGETLWVTERSESGGTTLIEATLDGAEVRRTTVFGSSFLLVWPDERGVTLSGFAEAVRLDRDLRRLDPPPVLATLRAYLSPWGGQSVFFEGWVVVALLLSAVPLLALSPKFRAHRAAWWVLAGVVAIEVGAVSQVLERLLRL